MPELDPRCVLVLPERSAAELIAAWLSEKGYGCELIASAPSVSVELLTNATIPEPPSYQVCILNAEQRDAALELLKEHQEGVTALRERELKRASRTGTIMAECEDCGKSSDWPATLMGTTETCPHCQNYIDIPDPEDDWSGFDFGQPEEESESA
jgi:hypothetical protein